ncbi:MAG: hypothetical protein IT406_03225 [Candidatus Yanofskybacteria bacterium]|nr:hypothetical protein [Candidatus Yanofskybacteria bacterium]
MAKQRLYAAQIESEYRGIVRITNHIVSAPSRPIAERALRARPSVKRLWSIRPIRIPAAFDRRAAIAFARRIAESIGSSVL